VEVGTEAKIDVDTNPDVEIGIDVRVDVEVELNIGDLFLNLVIFFQSLPSEIL
jgi:hypothetical protein